MLIFSDNQTAGVLHRVRQYNVVRNAPSIRTPRPFLGSDILLQIRNWRALAGIDDERQSGVWPPN